MLARTFARCVRHNWLSVKTQKMSFLEYYRVYMTHARAEVRARLKISKMYSSDKIDAFWLFDRMCSSKSHETTVVWSFRKSWHFWPKNARADYFRRHPLNYTEKCQRYEKSSKHFFKFFSQKIYFRENFAENPRKFRLFQRKISKFSIFDHYWVCFWPNSVFSHENKYLKLSRNLCKTFSNFFIFAKISQTFRKTFAKIR